MIIFDLKWIGFSLLIAVLGMVIIWHYFHRFRIGEAVIFQAAPFGFFILSAEQYYYKANAQACRLLGLTGSSGTLPDAFWVDLLAEDSQSLTGRYRQVAISDYKFVQWWLCSLKEVTWVFVMDITPLYQLKQSSQTLFSGLSHELRTPLATILTHLEIMGLTTVQPEVKAESLTLTKQEVQRMLRLVQQMLWLGRFEAQTTLLSQPINLLTLGQEVEQLLSYPIEFEADSTLPLVAGEADALKQLLMNLFDNAHKYGRGIIKLKLEAETQGVVCTVVDNGPGIPAHHVAHLGRLFYRVDPQDDKGSGLGLAIVTGILRRHQSELKIITDSTGTQMQFTLPLY